MGGQGVWAEQIRQTFHLHAARLGLDKDECRLSTAHFRRPSAALEAEDLPLFREC
jgi:hypothetical protein